MWNWLLFGVNFINVLLAAFAPVGSHQSYWSTALSVQCNFNLGLMVKFGPNFIGETERRMRMAAGTFALCAIRLVKLSPRFHSRISHLPDVSEPDSRMLLSVDVGLVVHHAHQVPAEKIQSMLDDILLYLSDLLEFMIELTQSRVQK